MHCISIGYGRPLTTPSPRVVRPARTLAPRLPRRLQFWLQHTGFVLHLQLRRKRQCRQDKATPSTRVSSSASPRRIPARRHRKASPATTQSSSAHARQVHRRMQGKFIGACKASSSAQARQIQLARQEEASSPSWRGCKGMPETRTSQCVVERM